MSNLNIKSIFIKIKSMINKVEHITRLVGGIIGIVGIALTVVIIIFGKFGTAFLVSCWFSFMFTLTKFEKTKTPLRISTLEISGRLIVKWINSLTLISFSLFMFFFIDEKVNFVKKLFDKITS